MMLLTFKSIQYIHFIVNLLKSSFNLLWFYYGKLYAILCYGMSGLWSVNVICSVKTEGGTEGIEGLCKGWVHPEAWSQTDMGFVVAGQCHAVHGFKDTLLLSLMFMLSVVPQHWGHKHEYRLNV